VGGATALTLSPEHLLLFLCAHGAQHAWVRLGWICDVAKLIEVEANMDWTLVFAQAKRTRTSRMLSLGLILVQKVLDVKLTPAMNERVASDSRAQELANSILERLVNVDLAPAPVLAATRLTLRTLDCTSQSLRYLLGTLLGPSEAEYRALHFPPALFNLYYLFRPLRLSSKYLKRALGSKDK
jgi:hypothetical protein